MENYHSLIIDRHRSLWSLRARSHCDQNQRPCGHAAKLHDNGMTLTKTSRPRFKSWPRPPEGVLRLGGNMIVDVMRICVPVCWFMKLGGCRCHPRHLHIFKISYLWSCTQAPPYMHSLPFLDDVNFVFVVASLSVDRVSDQFLQCTRSKRWQLFMAFRFGKSSFSTFLRWWNAIPQDISVTYHRKIQFSSRQQTKETTTGISTALALALTSRSGKRKRLDVSGSPSRVQTYMIVWIIFVDFKNTSYEALDPTCNMRKLHPKRATTLLGNARTLLDTSCNS